MAEINSKTLLSKSGKSVRLRSPEQQDARAIVEYKTVLSRESEYTVGLPSEFKATAENEKKLLQEFLSGQNSIAIIAEINGKIVGMISFSGKTHLKRIAHVGSFGVSIHPEFRRDGIGELLLRELIAWVSKHLTLRKIGLGVFSTNAAAISLYKKLDFEEEGRRIKEIQMNDGEFIDDIMMYKWVERNED